MQKYFSSWLSLRHWLGKACRYQAVRQPACYTVWTACTGCSCSPEIPEALLEEVALSSTTLGPAWGCDRPRLQSDCMPCQNIFERRPVTHHAPPAGTTFGGVRASGVWNKPMKPSQALL